MGHVQCVWALRGPQLGNGSRYQYPIGPPRLFRLQEGARRCGLVIWSDGAILGVVTLRRKAASPVAFQAVEA